MGSMSLRRCALRAALSLSVLVMVADRAAAGTPDVRTLGRCRVTITHESLEYVHRLEWRLNSCLYQQADRCGSSRMTTTCSTLARDVAALERGFRADVVTGCAGVPLASLAGDLGFAEQMTSCKAGSLDAFAACLVKNLRLAEAALVGRLNPNACGVLAQAGVADVMPAGSCSSDGGGAPPPASPPASGPLACGGPDNRACPTGLVCNRTDMLCTQSGVAGECVAPETCVDDGRPVCGCDGQTYASDCARLRAGVTRTHDGVCDPASVPCDFAHPLCPAGTFCDFPIGDCGEGGHGTCRPMRRDSCLLCTNFVHGPECGCNGTTYATDCERLVAGVSTWFEGTCP